MSCQWPVEVAQRSCMLLVVVAGRCSLTLSKLYTKFNLMDLNVLSNSILGKNEEQLPQETVGRQLANSWPTVRQLSFTAFYENLLPTVGRLLAVRRPTVGSMLVICWPSVG